MPQAVSSGLRHGAAEEPVGREIAQQDQRVGHSGLGAPAPVAGRAGDGPGRVRPDPEHAAGVAPPHRAAAGADRIDVDQRQRGPHAHHLAPVAPGGLATADQADIEAGAAHVARHHVARTGSAGHLDRRVHPGRRTGHHQAHGQAGRLGDRHRPAGRVHEQHGHAEAVPAQPLVQGDDPGHGAGGVGVEEGEDGPLVLPHDGVEGGAGRDRQVGVALPDDGDGPLLVGRVLERPQERHGQRLDALVGPQPVHGGGDLVAVHGAEHRTQPVDALVDAGDAPR